jgi:hypothetical protein
MTERRFPPAMVYRGNRRVLHRQGRLRPGAGLCLYEDEPGRRSAAKLLTKDEAWRIATNIAKLPDLLGDKS